MKVLTKRQILLLHSALIRQSGGSDGIRDEGLLDSAVSTPFQTFADPPAYNGIENERKVVGAMQVVVLKSPKCLRGLLRRLFGIKKETQD